MCRASGNGNRLADAKTSSAHCSASGPRLCPRKKLRRPPTSSGFARLVQEVRLRCVEAGYPPANWRTIKSRVEDLDARSVALRRGDKATIKATKATPGHYVAARPLAVVQIDHTRVDVVVVDEETREPIGRPWITFAIDV